MSFGIIPGVCGSIMRYIVPQIRARWPDVRLIVDEQSSARLEERLIGQHLDFAVLQYSPSLETLCTEPILIDKFGLIATPGTRVGSDHSPIRLHDLIGLPLVLPPATDNVRRQLEKACFQHGLRLTPFVETDSWQVAQAMVFTGLTFAVLPSLMVMDEVGRGRLIFREIRQPAITTVHSVVSSRASRSSPLAAEFIAIVRNAIISFVGTGDIGHAQPI